MMPRTPQQNGVVERQNRSIQQMASSMMNERNISQTYWVEAIHTTVHILNKAHLSPNSDKTPYELWFGKPASIKHFKVIGSKCYIKKLMNILGNMMIRLMKVDLWGMPQMVKDIDVIIRGFIKWLISLKLKLMKVCL